MRRLTQEIALQKVKKSLGDGYSFDKFEYVSYNKPVTVTCKKHGDFTSLFCNLVSGHGCYYCGVESHKKLVFGVGINDSDSYIVKGKKKNASYVHWSKILERCYYIKYQEKQPTYKGCEVCEEWKTYSNFRKWFNDPINGYRDGYQLDKDLICKNNKVYSPDTCCFLPQEINKLLSKRMNGKEIPVGVFERDGRYRSILHKYGRNVDLGTFSTISEAFAAYKQAKEAYIKEVAQEYYNKGDITKRVYDALMRYEVEIID